MVFGLYPNLYNVMQSQSYLSANSAEYYLYENRIGSKIIYKTILAAILLIIVSLPFIYVDITISAASTVRPELEKSTITAAVSEFVDSVYVKEGAKLHKGDIILTQRALKDNSQHRFQSDKEKELFCRINDFEKLSQGIVPSRFFSTAVREDYIHYQSQYHQVDVDREQYEIEWRKNKVLFDKGLISESEYNGVYYRYTSKRNELDVLKKNQKSIWSNNLYECRMQLKDVSATNETLVADKQLYVVKSPVDGTLEQFTGIYKGSNLTAGQQIAVVSPGGRLCLACYVSPRDIAFITKGMGVRIQIEALNYNEWGVINGHVMDIASDLTTIDNVYYYKVRCTLDKDYLELRHSTKKAYIKKGMSATAHFIVTRQSLFTLIYKNIDEWANPTQYKR